MIGLRKSFKILMGPKKYLNRLKTFVFFVYKIFVIWGLKKELLDGWKYVPVPEEITGTHLRKLAQFISKKIP